MDEMKSSTVSTHDVFESCDRNWSREAQLLMLIEKCGELTEITSKVVRCGRNDVYDDGLVCELVGVRLLIDQIIHTHGFTEAAFTWRLSKMTKLIDRLAHIENEGGQKAMFGVEES